MTVELLCGLFSIITALISIIGVALRINRAIVLLEAAVKRLTEHSEEQKAKNAQLERKLVSHDRRITHLERSNYSE